MRPWKYSEVFFSGPRLGSAVRLSASPSVRALRGPVGGGALIPGFCAGKEVGEGATGRPSQGTWEASRARAQAQASAQGARGGEGGDL